MGCGADELVGEGVYVGDGVMVGVGEGVGVGVGGEVAVGVGDGVRDGTSVGEGDGVGVISGVGVGVGEGKPIPGEGDALSMKSLAWSVSQLAGCLSSECPSLTSGHDGESILVLSP